MATTIQSTVLDLRAALSVFSVTSAGVVCELVSA
jgi:hypothetical protein